MYLIPALGFERLYELSPTRLSKAWRHIGESGGKGGKPVSPRTVEFARAVFRKAMKDAVANRLIQVDPVIGSKFATRDGKPKHTTWTGRQLRSFIEHERVHEDRWLPLWELAAATGMRRGELAGLRWEFVDLETGTIGVEVSTAQLGQKRVTTTPKNGEGRTIAIDPHTIATLKAWRIKQATERLAWGPAWADDEDFVFTWQNGTPILPDYMTKAFLRLQARVNQSLQEEEKATLPRLVLHGLRHTHATLLLWAGGPVHFVAKRLGHKDASVTLNVYANVIPEDDAQVVDIFTREVWSA